MKLSFQLPGNSKAGTSEFEDIVIEHSIDICEDSIFYLLRETHNILFITIGSSQLVHYNWFIMIGSLRLHEKTLRSRGKLFDAFTSRRYYIIMIK